MILPIFSKSIPEGQVSSSRMLVVMRPRHLSRFTGLKLFSSIWAQSKSSLTVSSSIHSSIANGNYSSHLGHVPTEPVSPALNENKLMSVKKTPKLSSMISLSDFEYAASKGIPERSFACKYLVQRTINSVLTRVNSCQVRCRGRICLQLEQGQLESNSLPSSCITADWNHWHIKLYLG